MATVGEDTLDFCAARYARGAGGITLFRAASDRDYLQEIVPFAETVLFKIMAPEHRGLSSVKRLHTRRHYAGERKLVGQVRDEPRAHHWDEEWCHGGVQTALMSWTSVDNCTMFKLQSRGVLNFVYVDIDVQGVKWN